MIITRAFSLTNFLIATSALCFQVGILYPWHHELDQEFKELKMEYRTHIRDLVEEQRKEREEQRIARLERTQELSKIREELEKTNKRNVGFGRE